MSESYSIPPLKPNGLSTDAEIGADAGVPAPETIRESVAETTIPSSARALAETVIGQNREAYERARESVDETVSMVEVTIERVSEGTIAFNRKAIDIVQDNLNSSFDLAKQLAGAETLGAFMELQVAFMRKQFGVFDAQAKDMRELTAQIADNTAAPLRAHLTHSIASLRETR